MIGKQSTQIKAVQPNFVYRANSPSGWRNN
jgi:hypothetical protein